MLTPSYVPVVNTLFLTTLILVLYYTYGAHNFYRDPNGIFYDSTRAYEKKYSLRREAEGLEFLNRSLVNGVNKARADAVEPQAPLHDKSRKDHHEDALVCGVIVSFGDTRNGLQHPLQMTIATLLDGLTIAERDDLDLNVYIANTHPEQHPLYEQPILQLVDFTVSARNVASPALFNQLVELEQSHAYINKTAYDFSLALQHCLDNSTAPYIMLFEDDIVAADGWFARTQEAIYDAEVMTKTEGRDWLDVRLFGDSKDLRWVNMRIWDDGPWLLAVLLPLLMPTIMGLTYLILRRAQRTKLGSGLYTMQSARLFCLASIPIFIIIFINTGYLATMPRQEGLKIQNWGCCTQGEVFPRARVPLLIDALQGWSATSPADLTVRDLATENDLLRFMMNPPVVQHVGSSSILTPDRPKKETVWSMAFEDLDALEMKLRHEELVEELYR